MFFQSREDIKRLESKIKNGYFLPIFKGYVAVNKYGVEQIIDAIYANLPYDVNIARKYLENHTQAAPDNHTQNEKIYDALKMLEMILEENAVFFNFTVLKIQEIETLLKKIEQNIPKEILQAEISDK